MSEYYFSHNFKEFQYFFVYVYVVLPEKCLMALFGQKNKIRYKKEGKKSFVLLSTDFTLFDR